MGEDDQVEMSPHCVADSDAAGEAGTEGASSRFGVTLEDLKTVNRDRATEDNLVSLSDMGGVVALAESLGSDVRVGISNKEVEEGFEERKSKYPRPRLRAAPAVSPRRAPPNERSPPAPPCSSRPARSPSLALGLRHVRQQ